MNLESIYPIYILGQDDLYFETVNCQTQLTELIAHT